MRSWFLIVTCVAIISCSEENKVPVPPVAEKIPVNVGMHGEERVDNYYWMNEYFTRGPRSRQVVQYLEQENEYAEKMLSDVRELRDTLFNEMKARIRQDDASAPVYYNGYYYYDRYETGEQYPLMCRKKGSMDAAEEVMIDLNEMSKGHDFFETDVFEVSPDNRYLAFAVDTLSRRQFTIYIKDLETGQILNDNMYPAAAFAAWANDSKTLFYIENNKRTLLTEKVKKHVVGTPATSDQIVYYEKDKSNYLDLERLRSGKFIVFTSEATLSSEVFYIDADHPDNGPKILQPRVKNVLYNVDEQNGKFLIRTNLHAKNFRLMEAPVESPGMANWKELIPHDANVLLEEAMAFKNYLVVSERKDGLLRMRVRTTNNDEHYIAFPEPSYTVEAGDNPEFDFPRFRFEYNSLTTPLSEYDYNVNDRSQRLVKREEVVGGYDPAQYATERLYAPAADGKRVPISLVYKKGFTRNGNAPLLLYGYGAYGSSADPNFSSTRLSLLDRGFTYAIAHVRGGQELGREWYEDGRMMNKKNTFADFIAAAEYLIKQQYTTPGHLYAYGGSAGGLLIGAVINMRPELFRGVVAEVPFVDAVTTMLDETIPLTTNEFDEWGNPKDKEAYEYIKSYSPYDNVASMNYPNVLAITGLHDSQVQYFETAKWIAKLREMKKGTNMVLMQTNMEYGHGGASGRFDYLKDIALMCAFYLKLERT